MLQTGVPSTASTDLLALKHKLLHGIEVKRRFAVDLLQQGEHEFAFYNFAELHKAGHFFWKFHDRRHPDFTDSEPQLRHALREVYAEMDRAIGAVLGQLGSEDDLVLVTDRGMYADYRGDHLIDQVLLKLELAVPRGPSNGNRNESWRTRLLNQRETRKALRFVGQKLLPESVRQALLPFHRAAVGESAPLDWHKTRVYAMPAVGNSHLRVISPDASRLESCQPARSSRPCWPGQLRICVSCSIPPPANAPCRTSVSRRHNSREPGHPRCPTWQSSGIPTHPLPD